MMMMRRRVMEGERARVRTRAKERVMERPMERGVWFNFSLKRNNLITGCLIWPIKFLTKTKRESTRAIAREKESDRDRNEGGREK